MQKPDVVVLIVALSAYIRASILPKLVIELDGVDVRRRIVSR